MARRVSLVDISGRRRRMRRMLLWGGIILGAGLLLVGVSWVVVYSEVFTLQDVRVNGATNVAPEEVRDFLELHAARGPVSRFLGSENILAWPGGFSEADLHALPSAAALDIRKNYFRRTVTVEVTERERLGIWCFEEPERQSCFWFDADGVLFLPAYAAEGNLTPVLHDHGRPALALGDTALSARLLPNLISVFRALGSTHLSVREVRLEDLALEEVRVRTYDGPELLFSLRFPAEGVSEAISKVEGIVPLSQLQYIDFRVENKVYYK